MMTKDSKNFIVQRSKRGMVQVNSVSVQELEQAVSDFMLELGIPAHLRGYQYLRSAVLMCVEDMELVGSVTKLLYPDLAKLYHTTDQKIERAIRNAIEVSWGRGNSELFEQLFGYSNTDGYSRPTNSEYIATVADYIRLTYELV
jgi:two-component system response regulator (stage 0 sporulation protein A)